MTALFPNNMLETAGNCLDEGPLCQLEGFIISTNCSTMQYDVNMQASTINIVIKTHPQLPK